VEGIAVVLLAAAAFIISYTWVGFPLVLGLLTRLRQVRICRREFFPLVSVIVAAKNEEENIRERIENLLELDYPSDKLEIIIASDGSTDRTTEYVRQICDPRIRFFDFAQNRGKAAVHNDLVPQAQGSIVVLTDAATRFGRNFLSKLLPNFADPRVGCVTGVLWFRNHTSSMVAKHRGLYWRYEYMLRNLQSRCGVYTHGSGPCMAVRKELYRPLRDRSYDADFMTPLDVVEAGYLVQQENEAIASETLFQTPKEEIRAQIRMVTRNVRGYLHRRWLLGSPKTWPVAWALISHKLLRWLTPFVLIVLFAANSYLAARGRFLSLWVLQCAFYGCAAFGWLLARLYGRAWIFAIPYTFCLANAGFMVGVTRAVRGRQIPTWK
jgi:cellulose synthase/poly-beta-1,6-N-acetylglucosamine synthase-like glycosyltransferase